MSRSTQSDRRRSPLRPGGGLAVAAAAGILLFITEAAAYLQNPVFAAKLALILRGLVNLALFQWRFRAALRRWPPGTAPPASARIAGQVSLVTWIVVLICGRSIAYL